MLVRFLRAGAGYSIYTLYYNKHKSWYSWILNSLVGAVYTFGFILMCPQVMAGAGALWPGAGRGMLGPCRQRHTDGSLQ